jgi:hypothetical protein
MVKPMSHTKRNGYASNHSSAKFIALEAPHFSSRETLITVFMNPDYMVGT